MEILNFTSYVLGPKAVSRLRDHQVTQTIRSGKHTIGLLISRGKVKPNDLILVTLDGKPIGHARYLSMNEVNWGEVDLGDAQRGGFDNLSELDDSLRRGGYLWLPLEEYTFYRLRFAWDEPKLQEGRANRASPSLPGMGHRA